jgi:hypothetical protein
MPKTLFNPAEYALVADRIIEFYDRFPTGRIITELVSRKRDIVFRAEVYRSAGDPAPAATGWASEREGDGEINLVACLENSETSAIGRALANLGFTASKKRPSYEEMQKAERARLRLRVAETKLESPASEDRVEPALTGNAFLQAYADENGSVTADVVLLLREAAENGVPAFVLDAFRQKIETGYTTTEELEVMQRQLRHWILEGYSPSPPVPPADSGESTSAVNSSRQ